LYSFYHSTINKTITGDLFNHLIKSLRFNIGDCFLFFDDENEYSCKITLIEKAKAFYEIVSYHKIIETNKPFITLIQGFPKYEKADFICKYSTLFNVKEIIFVYMRRSIPKLSNIENKLARFESIIKEAVTISKRKSVPKVSIVNSLKDIDYKAYNSVYLLDEESTTHHNIKKEDNIALIVGPEGGIDDYERTSLKDIALSVSLGENILTTESASLAILALFL
jgi:16S rRNA (uracil1498-N3)-methyltransferase